jgi:apolipoprotein N-acyltransferase
MKKRILLACLSGAMLVAAFPPLGLAPLAWVAFVPLFMALDGATRARAALLGFVSGFAFYLGTVYWVVNSMHYYGGVPLWAGVPVMLLLVSYLSLYTAAFGLIYGSATRTPALSTVFVPCLWVALEYLRGRLFTGFPWVLTGYSQASYLPIAQVADATGVWGLSFLVVSVNAALFLISRPLALRGAKGSVKGVSIAAVLVVAALVYGFWRMEGVEARVRDWKPIRAGVAQGSIDQSVKWDASYQDETLEIYRGLSLRAAGSGASIIVWPETAVPFYLSEGSERGLKVMALAREMGSYILTGSPSYNYNGETGETGYYNSAYIISPDGAIAGRYDKFHLVPYGEYVPLKRFFPFIKKLTAGVGDFREGPGPYPIGFGEGNIGVIICFEAIFPEIARETVANGAGLLVNLTNDAWFGRTSAPYQHLGMTALRAVENRSYLIRAANTGISAVVDPTGRVLKTIALFERDVLVEDVRLRQGALTFYSRYGDVFAYACMAVSLYALLGLWRGGGAGR